VFSAPNPFASNPSPPAAPAASGFSFQQAPSKPRAHGTWFPEVVLFFFFLLSVVLSLFFLF